ncbi:hypothetical protein XFEB_00188 [Xylella fastidiosa EB92.1]|nr:hypothetical protein XFEB_00188 [Xylella fastidiosa EB92.1]
MNNTNGCSSISAWIRSITNIRFSQHEAGPVTANQMSTTQGDIVTTVFLTKSHTNLTAPHMLIFTTF